MRLKPFPTFLYFLCLPGFAAAGEKTVYGRNEDAALVGTALEVAAKLLDWSGRVSNVRLQ